MNRPVAISRICALSIDGVGTEVEAGEVTHEGEASQAEVTRIGGVIHLLFDKFKELGGARQVLLWPQDQGLQLPVTRRNSGSSL